MLAHDKIIKCHAITSQLCQMSVNQLNKGNCTINTKILKEHQNCCCTREIIKTIKQLIYKM